MASTHRAYRPFSVQSIAIIGAGPSGMAVAKYLVAERVFKTIDIFERQAEVGGVWNYTPDRAETVPVPQTTPYVPADTPFRRADMSGPVFSNPMYDKLITNIPKKLMQYTDQDFLAESLLYPTREDVQEYLIKYSQDIRHLISFSTQVRIISPSHHGDQARWRLNTTSTSTGEESCKDYDAIVVANGHYSVPFIPSVLGIEAFQAAYPSTISHSKIYRSTIPFNNKKVIVVGNAASGLDIGTQISRVCKKPLLNSVHHPSADQSSAGDKKEVPAIIEFMVEDRSVKFEDGHIEKYVDAVVYCTGYLYSYPFLESLTPPVVLSGHRVLGLWQHLFNILHPTLAFTALPQKIIPFPLSEVQGAAIAKVWSNQLQLPSKTEMTTWERQRVQETGNGTTFHILGFPHDASYINFLHDWVMTADRSSGKRPPFWDERARWMREIYAEIRKRFVEDGSKAKTIEELGFYYERQTHKPEFSVVES